MDMNWVWAKLLEITVRALTISNQGHWVITRVELRSMEEVALLEWFLNQEVNYLDMVRIRLFSRKSVFNESDFYPMSMEAMRRPKLKQRTREHALAVLIRDVYWNRVFNSSQVVFTLKMKGLLQVKNYTKDKRKAVAAQLAAVNYVIEAFEKATIAEYEPLLHRGVTTLGMWVKGELQPAAGKELSDFEDLQLCLDDYVVNSEKPDFYGTPVQIMLVRALDCVARVCVDCDITETRNCYIDTTSLWWAYQALMLVRELKDVEITEEEAYAEVLMVWHETLHSKET